MNPDVDSLQLKLAWSFNLVQRKDTILVRRLRVFTIALSLTVS